MKLCARPGAVLLALALAAAAAAPSDRQLPEPLLHYNNIGNASAVLAAAGVAGALVWAGEAGAPAGGCAHARGPSELTVDCALPAGPLTLATDRAASYLNIQCEPRESERGVWRAGEYRCAELAAARASLAAHVDAAGPHAVRSLAVRDCALREPLACALALLNGTDVATVVLRGLSEPLSPDLLAGLTNVTHLRIVNAGQNITRVPYEALGALPALRRFDLRGAALQLAAGWAPVLPHLTMLELSEDRLAAIPARAFDGLPQLQNLSLWGNKIVSLDEKSFEGLDSLQRLSLNSNAVEELPRGLFLPTPHLRALQLFRNKLRMIPHDLLRNLTHLEEIWIDNANSMVLEIQNGTFADLPALRSLRVEWCGARAVPGDLVRGAGALRVLSLQGNQLRALPPGLLAGLTELEELKLSRNLLTTLPRHLLRAQARLQRLDLSRNEIQTLPDFVFQNLVNLKNLDLSRNKIVELRSFVFDGLTTISELSLAYNMLRLAPAEQPAGGADGADGAGAYDDAERYSPLAGLLSLSRLVLAHNAVPRVMDDWRRLVYLKSLDLSYNSITELQEVDMDFLSAAEIDLRHNNISRVKPWQISESNAKFLLDDNPFECDCMLYDFVRMLKEPSVWPNPKLEAADARCAAPPQLRGTGLAALAPAALVCALPAPACPAACACALRPARARLELSCAAVPRTAPPPARYGLAAADLRLTRPIADLTALPPEVRFVNLSGLHLTAVPPVSSPVELELDLTDNDLEAVPVTIFESNVTLHLAGNPIACDCAHRDDVAMLKSRAGQVRDYANVTCRGGGRLESAARLCAMRDAALIGGSLAALGLALALLAVLSYRFSTEIRLVLRRYECLDCLFAEEPLLDSEKEYDAFVSFSHRDEQFVRSELVPRLEGGRRPLRLCLHYRDWVVGDLIPEQIARSVERSRRTIVVLSADFVQSVWGKTEFHAAHGLERVIVLVRGDALREDRLRAEPELRAYIASNTYVHADDPLVWDRLRDAVLRSRARPRAPAPSRAPALKHVDKLARPGLDVRLQDGKLVNDSWAASSP